ncbi:hypothetical protein HanRHA438_Chr12g0550411 [Helianthus annuus]|nr:hypothetical protein HanIR_Chr12g0581111 [Helianthus annuus]KAJ0866320.1 hypothetical protein HanRHA438_Chr12g0550411 [Helianthus annuus]
MPSLPPPPQFYVTSPTSTPGATGSDLHNRRTSTCRPSIVRRQTDAAHRDPHLHS